MSKYIKKDDIWGIRKAVKQLWDKKKEPNRWYQRESEIAFDAFFNQFIPMPYKETKEAVIRHKDQILAILNSLGDEPGYVWLRQGKSLKCCQINNSTINRLRQEKDELPTYEEIEEEKMTWQANPKYKKELGFSQPIKEEFVQLKFKK